MESGNSNIIIRGNQNPNDMDDDMEGGGQAPHGGSYRGAQDSDEEEEDSDRN